MASFPDKIFDRSLTFVSFAPMFSGSFCFYGWLAGYFSRAIPRRLR